MFKPSFFLITCTLLLMTQRVGVAQTPTNQKQSIELLYKKAETHIRQKTEKQLFNLKFKIKPISKHLKLSKCQQPVQLEDTNAQKYFGRMSLLFRCTQPFWKLYMSVNVQGDLPVVVTSRGLLEKSVISPKDVTLTYMPYQKIKKNSFVDPAQVIGMRTKRAIGPNLPLSVRMLQPPFWVFKNQDVKIVTYAGNLKVESVGTALEDAVRLEQVEVRNNFSKKIIKGIVVAPNTVEIP